MRGSLSATLVGAVLAGTVAFAPAAGATPVDHRAGTGAVAPVREVPSLCGGGVGILSGMTRLCFFTLGVHDFAGGLKVSEIDSGDYDVLAYTTFGGLPVRIEKGRQVVFQPPVDLVRIVITL